MDLHYVQGKAFFTGINKVPRQYPYLTENLDTEVVVIGGGITGSIVGYYLAKNGISCVLLEKERIAHGSSSITTALLQYELDSTARELEPYTSLEKIIASYRLGQKALDELANFIEANGNACDYHKRDALLYTNKQLDAANLKEEYLIRKNAGFDVEFLTPENNPFSFDLTGGVLTLGGGAEIDPYKYTHHLLEVSTKNGLKVYENTEVIKLNYLPEGVLLETAYGYEVKAKKVILATGYNTNDFSPREYGTKTVTYNIATKPLQKSPLWHNNTLIRDHDDPYHYFRTTADNRIIAGGYDVPFDPGIFDEKTAKESYSKLEQKIKQVFPDLSPVEIDYAYCGCFASTQDNLGFVGPDPKHEHLWYCLGYGANGILFAILGGLMLAKLYKGEEDESLPLFKVNRFDH